LVLGPLETNCYVVADTESGQTLVADCAADHGDVLTLAEREALRIVALVATHGHPDHIGAMAKLAKATGARTAIHPADAKMAATRQYGALVFLGYVPPPMRAGRLLEDGDEVAVGRARFRVVHTPGHTEGSICLAGEGLLLSGDTLFAGGVGRTDLPGGDPEAQRRTLMEVLPRLDPTLTVLPGHGPTTVLGPELHTNPFTSATP
jgi:glyoxylase-like metal-dependent hydrolase (beta-lactamase superfamily II)